MMCRENTLGPSSLIRQPMIYLISAPELLAGREEELTFKFGSSKAFQFYRVVVTRGGLHNFSGKL